MEQLEQAYGNTEEDSDGDGDSDGERENEFEALATRKCPFCGASNIQPWMLTVRNKQ